MSNGRLSAILLFVAAVIFCSSCQGRADEMTQEVDRSAVRAGMKKSITSKEQQQIGGLEKLDFDKRCESKRDIVYRKRVGSDDDSDKMDIYCPGGAGGHKPVVVFVHGGGWVGGDKSNLDKNPRLLQFFIDNDYVVASPNFRPLLKDGGTQISFKDQLDDIARAVFWLTKNVGTYGGAGDSFILVGYSSGAHLASLISCDRGYFARHGMQTSIIKAVVALDVHTYDIPLALEKMKGTSLEKSIPELNLLFGREQSIQDEASPMFYVQRADKIPFLIISAGKKDGKQQEVSNEMSELFKNRLLQAGHRAVHINFEHRSHESMVLGFGYPQDGVSRVVKLFLDNVRK
jgi:acetyl esterase/lipase